MRTLTGRISPNAAPLLLDALELNARANAAIAEAGSARAWAHLHGLDPVAVSQIRNAHREPTEAYLRALGVRKIVRYLPLTDD
ncbi:hypothetical protein [Salinarimonas rosea]|uniref:hypothetical protein n=1 Tax=Salinarimonas rosea TaxID=552063 RepID=UPI00040EDD42|nr:hypothetical protein [Salinarimonas rosea]